MTTLKRTFPTLKLPKLDRVWLLSAILLLLLGLLIPDQARRTLGFLWQSVVHIMPFLLFSAVVAAYVKATGADKRISAVLTGRASTVVVVGALFGALSPFCSCGVIPIIAALLASGVPLAGIMAFWLASPLMSPEIFLLTTGEFGMGFALARTFSAIGIGLLAGFATLLLVQRGWLANPLRVTKEAPAAKPATSSSQTASSCCNSSAPKPEVTASTSCCSSTPTTTAPATSCSSAPVEPPPQSTSSCCTTSAQPIKPMWRFWNDSSRRQTFAKEVLEVMLFLGKWLTLAFILESLMLRYIPAESIAQVLGSSNVWAIPLATFVGIPAYLNGYAAIPMVAGLMELGMAGGAALAFLNAGAMTSIPAAMAVYPLVKNHIFMLYVLFAVVGAFASGLIYTLW